MPPPEVLQQDAKVLGVDLLGGHVAVALINGEALVVDLLYVPTYYHPYLTH